MYSWNKIYADANQQIFALILAIFFTSVGYSQTIELTIEDDTILVCVESTLQIQISEDNTMGDPISWEIKGSIEDEFEEIDPSDENFIVNANTPLTLIIEKVKLEYDNASFRLNMQEGVSPVLLLQVGEAPPDIESVEATPSTQICPDIRTFTLNASLEGSSSLGPYDSFIWYKVNSSDTTNSKEKNFLILESETLNDGDNIYSVMVKGCSEGMAESITISKATESDPIDEITSEPNSFICLGQEVVLSGSGGNHGTEAKIVWYDTPDGDREPIGEGASITVSPTSTTTYYVRREGFCNNTADKSIKIDISDEIQIKVNGNLLSASIDTIYVSESIPYTFSISTNPPDAKITWTCEEIFTSSLDGFSRLEGTDSPISATWNLKEKEDNNEAFISCTVNAELEGCANEVVTIIKVTRLLFVPDIITPNGDNLNENWEIKVLNDEVDSDDLVIRLFNRQGVCVWGCKEKATVSLASEFTGQNIADGPLFYIIEGPHNYTKTGSVTIFRN